MKTTKKDLELPGSESKNATAEKKTRKPRQKYIPLAERFKDVPDVVGDEHCQNYLTKRLATIKTNREALNKKVAGKNMRLTRAECDTLIDLGMWDAKSISDEFLLIAQKRSRLSGVIRRYIETLVIEGMNSALDYYRAIETKRANKLKKSKAI